MKINHLANLDSTAMAIVTIILNFMPKFNCGTVFILKLHLTGKFLCWLFRIHPFLSFEGIKKQGCLHEVLTVNFNKNKFRIYYHCFLFVWMSTWYVCKVVFRRKSRFECRFRWSKMKPWHGLSGRDQK
jgi:hypothetical protein